MSRPRELIAALIAVALGGGLALLGSSRPWDTVDLTRTPPLGPLRFELAGRTVQPGVTGLAVVALAGVVALIATRGIARRIVGAVLTATGVALAALALRGLAAVSDARARTLVLDAHSGLVINSDVRIEVSTSPLWAVLAALGGVLIAAGGLLGVVRAGRWSSMGTRYDAPSAPRPAPVETDAETVRARADLALWQSIDRGEDPTAEAGGETGFDQSESASGNGHAP